ncbi:MAG: ABC transporter permease [Solirubrobacteraceae bacterium]
MDIAPFDAALVASMLVIVAPLLVAATGEMVSQTAGVLNIGLEGMVLAGAFTSFAVMHSTGSMTLAFGAGLVGGLLCAVVMAALSIEARADQIVVGIGINLLVIGLTSFLNADLFSDNSGDPLDTLGTLKIPLLSDLGGIGKALFDQDVFVYGSFLLMGVTAWAINRTAWGIGLRAVGENPLAADAAGISVRAVRWAAVLMAGGCAGLAGAYLSVGQLGVFRDQMSAGRGFLALTAVLFGRWRPWGVLGACGVFAFTDALQLRLQGYHQIPEITFYLGAALVTGAIVWTALRSRTGLARLVPAVLAAVGLLLLGVLGTAVSVPTTLWLAAPFVLALLALAAAGVRRTAMPSALAIPFTRGE